MIVYKRDKSIFWKKKQCSLYVKVDVSIIFWEFRDVLTSWAWHELHQRHKLPAFSNLLDVSCLHFHNCSSFGWVTGPALKLLLHGWVTGTAHKLLLHGLVTVSARNIFCHLVRHSRSSIGAIFISQIVVQAPAIKCNYIRAYIRDTGKITWQQYNQILQVGRWNMVKKKFSVSQRVHFLYFRGHCEAFAVIWGYTW